ncbi:PREDICTED: uncharacterized protein LOC108554741, partial [Eufriesea mexicana]|uniref:uncharacterized protein LOC108554741 n=1 Tax=Eufriesea mexicana TaxID=516756 RepID=UPI00083C655F
RHLMAFVYVSTAYSHHYNQTIEEKVTEEVVQSIVDKWINIYSFSKATTEELVRDFARK